MDYLCDVERIGREVAAASETLLFELEGSWDTPLRK